MTTDQSASESARAVVRADPNRWRMLAFVALAQFMVLLDTTVVNLALPSIQKSFQASTTGIEWVLTGYITCFGGLMLLGGRAADRWGRKNTFLIGALVFVVASATCGLASGTGVLIASRVVQGCGAAFLSPAAMSLVTTTFTSDKERKTALSIWASLAGLGATLGVIIGGLVTTSLSWRWIFLINIPVGIIAVSGVIVLARPTASRPSAARPDLAGAITATGALMLAIYAITSIQPDGWSSASVIAPAVIAVVLAAAFIAAERRAADALIPLRLFRTRSLTAALIGRILTSAVQSSLLFLTAFYMQRAIGYSVLRAGFAFLPLAVVTVGITIAASKFMRRTNPRTLYALGACGSALALIWLTQVPDHADYALHLLPALLLLGASMPACGIPVNVYGVSEIPHEQQGIASGVLTASFQTGGALGIAVVATIAAARIIGALHDGTAANVAWTNGVHIGYWITLIIGILNIANALIGFRRAPQ